MPVLIMVPGTDGVDERQDFYRPALMAAGIGTLELDTKTGVFTSEKDRPDASVFVPVVFSALRTLRAVPAVDPDRIAILGWSAGGTVSMRAAWAAAAASGWLPTSAVLRLTSESTESTAAAAATATLPMCQS